MTLTDGKGLGIRFAVLRAGLLVGLHVRIDGGRSYKTTPVEVVQDDGTKLVARWETTRTIDDQEEWERAADTASKVAGTVRKTCVQTDFGPMCPSERLDDLWAAVREARAIAADFNRGATYSRIRCTMMPAMVGDLDPAQAARAAAEAEYAVAGEIRSLLEAMEQGIAAADPEAIREACNKARLLGSMLDETQAARVGEAIKAARTVARRIVAKVEKEGETAERVLADLRGERSAVEAARFAYLDLEAQLAPEGEALPSVNVQRFADLDIAAPAAAETPAPSVAAPDLDLSPTPAAPASEAPSTAARDLEIPDAPAAEPDPDEDEEPMCTCRNCGAEFPVTCGSRCPECLSPVEV